jgi:hypothetical protein
MPPETLTPHDRRQRWRFVAVGVGMLLMAGVYLSWRALSRPVGAAELTTFLEKRAANTIHISSLEIGTVAVGDGRLRISFAAKGRTVEPLYVRVDAAEYLSRELHITIESATNAGSGASASQAAPIPESGSLGPPPPDPRDATILQLRNPTGTPVLYQGTLEAVRSNNGWDLKVIDESFGDAGTSLGRSRASFGSSTFVVGEPSDAAELLARAAALSKYASRLADAKRVGAAARKDERSARLQSFIEHLAPGTLYRGAAVDQNGQSSPALFLEITGLSGGNQVNALLRNDGGWHDSRRFRGEWSDDPDCRVLSITLSSRPNEAIRNSGPILEDAQLWRFNFQADANGDLTGADRNYRYHFARLSAGQAASLKEELAADFDAVFAATMPGAVYDGVAVSRSTQNSEPLILRFVERDEAGTYLAGRFESPTRKIRRAFTGSLIGNSHRSAGLPVRLVSAAANAAPDAGGASMLGCENDLALRMRLDGQNLIGEDALFSYRFSPATAADLHAFDAVRAERSRRFLQALKPSIEYDGTIRDDQGYVVHTRLHILRVEPEKRLVAATIESRGQTRFFREFTGSCDPSEGLLVLDTTSRANLDSDSDLGVPLFSAGRRFSVRFLLSEDDLVGKIDNDEQTTLDFPLGTFLQETPILPSYPVAAGGYVLKGGVWLALPRNGGRAIPYKPPSKTNPLVRDLGGILNSATGGLLHAGGDALRPGDSGAPAPRPGKASDLMFDGRDPIPEVDGAHLVVLYVGAPQSPPKAPASGQRNSNDRPSIEIAPTTTGKDGKRSADLIRISPDVQGFGNQRIAAYVFESDKGTVLLTATGPVPAGTYAVDADEPFELEVR